MKLEGPRQRPNLRMSLFAPGLLRGAGLRGQHVAARPVVIGRVQCLHRIEEIGGLYPADG
jgi:hypothetical protein